MELSIEGLLWNSRDGHANGVPATTAHADCYTMMTHTARYYSGDGLGSADHHGDLAAEWTLDGEHLHWTPTTHELYYWQMIDAFRRQ